MIQNKVLSRVFDRLNTTMFHGSHSGNYNSLLTGVNVKQSKRKLDFGQGFYLTSDFQQASEHAVNKANGSLHKPLVFVYEIQLGELKQNYKRLILDRMNEVWAEFIYENRSPSFSKLHDYDYVYGGVADGQNLFDLLEEMDNGKITSGTVDISYFLEQIAKYTYDQLSIHNQLIFINEVIKLKKVVIAYDAGSEYIPA